MQISVRSIAAFITNRDNSARKAPRRIPHLFVHRFVPIECGMTRCIGFVVTDVAVDNPGVSRRNEFHVEQPIRQPSPEDFSACGIAMDYNREGATFKMPGVGPACQLKRFCLLGILSAGVMIIIPCAATHRGDSSFIQSFTCPMA
jgi:hypothetical protein